ncbi:MAG: DUF169 domain-containing protein [bacterium]|nr:MAG: DUF169 domain-containing protein [bacterium]
MKFRREYAREEYHKVGKSLKEKLALETEIVSVKFIKSQSEIPNGFIRPAQDMGRKMTICMSFAEARREGKKLAITVDDTPCTPGAVVQGWAKVSFWAFVKSQIDNKWQKNALSMIRGNNKRYKLGGWSAQYPFNRLLGHRGVLVTPLSETTFVPDTVIIFGYPEQLTHVAHSLSYEGRYVPKAILTGFGESCLAAGLIPLKSKKPVFALLGMGDRALRCVNKFEVAIGMPGSMIFYVNDNLFKSGGEHNLKHYLENPEPLEKLDESMLPGWTNVRKLINKHETRF